MKPANCSKYRLFVIQSVIAAFGFSVFLWKLVDVFRLKFMDDMYAGVKPWAYPYYHPYSGGLLNYLFLCSGIGAVGLLLYVFLPKYSGALKARLDSLEDRGFYTFFGFSFVVLGIVLVKLSALRIIVPALLLSAIPLAQFIPRKIYKKSFYCALFLMFAVLMVEPLRLFVGPVPLMNEYPEISSETRLDGLYVKNSDFLSKLPELSRDLKLHEKIPGEEGLDFLIKLKKPEIQAWGNALASGSPVNYSKLLSLQAFVKANALEYEHQVMGRGQINHIGYILNPVNEYDLGKPLTKTYMQYGVGNTLLFKRTMQAFGGVSIANYYKCYLYYFVYYAIFLAMLIYVFRDITYVLCGFSAVAFMHFSYNYIAFVLAPGIIPTIHFFDAALILALAAFLRNRSRWGCVLFSGLLVACAIFLNRQFGGMLAVSWVAAMAVYGLENKAGSLKYLWLLLPLLVTALAVWLTGGGSGDGAGGILKSYFYGFFSWPPKTIVVAFTMAYIVLSYLFLIRIRENRSDAKYLYLFSFFYSQGLFVYFYWSGLLNHLPLLFPFITLQLLFAALLIEKKGFGGGEQLWKWVYNVKPAAVLFSVLLVAVSALYFYLAPAGQKEFYDNFKTHKCYNWTFKNAKLVSTINPDLFSGAVALIQKYSEGKGIYIISKYDNILPFLSGRYSLMPHFEMPWYMISDKLGDEVFAKLESMKPEYLFADSDMNAANPDPWAAVYALPLLKTERPARAGRLMELRELFNKEAPNYKLVEAGSLMSVYRRIASKSE
ncbi:MAG: hypothetical protein NTX59_10610 [Elusimicrobia bacterium]|nr:hypothetical protein [Elusimicrobiota bacterium]